jgi:protein gp37
MPLPDGSWEGAENCVECEIQNIPFRPKVFCASLADWLDPEAPDVWRADLLKLIHITPHLDWLLLSKRPENFALLAHRAWACGGPADFGDWMGRWLKGDAPDNVWVGATVENQDNEKRITDLLNIPARVRFLSCEPLLGPVDISPYTHANPLYKLAPERPAINWVICGGETGPNPRPMHPDWARSLRDQCKHAGVPFFFKQNGEYIHESQIRPGFRESPSYMCEMRLRGPIHEWNDGTISAKCGRKAAGHLLDGVEHNEFPEVK